MFKALNVQDNSEVVIIDPRWSEDISHLRDIDRQNQLVCQGCRQPVRVRAGEQRREHFSHKHLENCTYADESAILRSSRALLYKWLKSKFGTDVTIEKQLEGMHPFRPVDCWVTKDSKVFAYWIFDSSIKQEKRMNLQYCAQNLGIHFHWVFATSMLRRNQVIPNELYLSTTEREFIQGSKYDAIYSTNYHSTKGTLHYLDYEKGILTTFRGLSKIHGPQVYSGHVQSSELENILISPQTGEFVYKGEHEALKKQEQELVATRSERFVKRPESTKLENSTHSRSLILSNNAKCVHCGEITNDWWSFDGKTGLCKCKSCLKQGKH